jgi:predicted ATPase
MYLGWLAEAYQQLREFSEGLLAINEALTIIDRTGERVYEAELYRLKGDLMLSVSTYNLEETECCYRTAIGISREQHTRSLELRATMSLARLLAKQGRRDEARAMLANIYNWFTEGFGTADLKDAKVLLDELSR